METTLKGGLKPLKTLRFQPSAFQVPPGCFPLLQAPVPAPAVSQIPDLQILGAITFPKECVNPTLLFFSSSVLELPLDHFLCSANLSQSIPSALPRARERHKGGIEAGPKQTGNHKVQPPQCATITLQPVGICSSSALTKSALLSSASPSLERDWRGFSGSGASQTANEARVEHSFDSKAGTHLI